MACLSNNIIRLRMIEWRNWKKEVTQSRVKIQEFKKKIKELEDEVAEKDCVISERERRIKELEEEVKKLKGIRSKLQKIVFKDEEKQEGENKRGAKNGHKSSVRKKPKQEDITKHETIKLQHCPKCKAKLGAPHSWRTRYSIDIPPPNPPDITEWQLARYHCKGCNHWVQSKPPGLSVKAPLVSTSL